MWEEANKRHVQIIDYNITNNGAASINQYIHIKYINQ